METYNKRYTINELIKLGDTYSYTYVDRYQEVINELIFISEQVEEIKNNGYHEIGNVYINHSSGLPPCHTTHDNYHTYLEMCWCSICDQVYPNKYIGPKFWNCQMNNHSDNHNHPKKNLKFKKK